MDELAAMFVVFDLKWLDFFTYTSEMNDFSLRIVLVRVL